MSSLQYGDYHSLEEFKVTSKLLDVFEFSFDGLAGLCYSKVKIV